MNRKAKFALVLVISLAASLGATAAARAATVVGQLPPPFKFAVCTGSLVAQTLVPSGTTSHRVPAGGGVITSWQTATATGAGSAKLKILRPTGPPGQYVVVAEDGPRQVAAETSPTFSGIRIPVQAGDLLGLIANGTNCISSLIGMPYGSNTFGVGDPALGSALSAHPTEWEWGVDVRATVEPDADGDGFGDETQDFCPADAVAQLPPCNVAMPAPTPSPAVAVPRPPRLSLHGRAVQAALRLGGVVELVESDRAAALRANGWLLIAGAGKRLPLLSAVAEASGDDRTRLVLRFTRAQKRRVAAALGRGQRVRVRIGVTASAGATAASAERRIAIKQAKKEGK